MIKKLQNTTNKLWPAAAILVILAIWQTASGTGMVSKFLLPSPVDVVRAFVNDFPLLMANARVTILESFIGLLMGVVIGFLMAVLMDHFDKLYKAFYPLIVLTQTVPTVAIAPLLVLWFGYEMLPKVILIVIVTFFPITVSLLDGFRSAAQGYDQPDAFYGCVKAADIPVCEICRDLLVSFLPACGFQLPMQLWEPSFQNGWVDLKVWVSI